MTLCLYSVVVDVMLFKFINMEIKKDGLIHKEYYLELQRINLFTDHEVFAKVADEKLKCHFFSFEGDNHESLNIYALQCCNYNLLEIMGTANKPHNWSCVHHMNNKYYTCVLLDGTHITVWKDKHMELNYEINQIADTILDMCIHGKNNTHLLINCADENYYYFYNSINEFSSYVPMRLIRSFFMIPLIRNNFIYYHAAALEYHGKGILITGGTGSGKTSTVLRCINDRQVKLVANDKVFLGVDRNNNIKAQGWPTAVNIGVGNLRQYDQLQALLSNIDDVPCNQQYYYDYKPKPEYMHMSSEELKSLGKKGHKLATTHAHISRLFNKEIKTNVCVNAIINVKLEWGHKKKIIRKLKEDEKQLVIHNNIIKNISDQLCWIGHPYLEQNVNHLLVERVAREVQFYEYKADFRDTSLSNFLDDI